MTYIMLSNLQFVFFFVFPIIETFKKVLMHHLIISSIVVYHTTLISNILNKMADYIKLRIVKSWLI